MAYLSSTGAAPSAVTAISRGLAAPFRAIGRAFVRLAEADPRNKEIAKLNAMTDAELAARGTSRVAEVRRLFASSGLL